MRPVKAVHGPIDAWALSPDPTFGPEATDTNRGVWRRWLLPVESVANNEG